MPVNKLDFSLAALSLLSSRMRFRCSRKYMLYALKALRGMPLGLESLFLLAVLLTFLAFGLVEVDGLSSLGRDVSISELLDRTGLAGGFLFMLSSSSLFLSSIWGLLSEMEVVSSASVSRFCAFSRPGTESIYF